MEKSLKSKMGVDNVDMILENVKSPVVAARCASNGLNNPALSDPVLEAAKSLLASMSHSTAEITTAMKPFRTPEKSWSYNKKKEEMQSVRNGIDQAVKLGQYRNNNKAFPVVKKTLNQRSLNMMSVPRQAPFTIRQVSGIPKTNFFPPIVRDEVTLTLDPVVERPVKNFPYAKYIDHSSVHAKAQSEDSALQRIQDWHSRHLQKLLISTALDAASKKLKTLSGMERSRHDFAGVKNQQHLVGNSKKTTVTGLSTKINPEQKQNYFTVSHRYYQYLNRPKCAKHDSFQVIFRACVLINSQPDRPTDNTLYPTTFIKWPSGKIPLPGYKPISEFRKKIQKNVALKKKRRTVNTYRIVKPKLKFNPLLFKHFPQSMQKKLTFRKPLQRKEYLPVKWDSVAKRFTLQTNKSNVRPIPNSNWFSYPTSQLKSSTDVLKRFGTSGAVINTSRPNHRPLMQYKTVPSSMKLQQNRKVVQEVFKCATLPNPELFKTYNDYTEVCLLYRVRKRMAAIAMKFGYVEGRVYPTPEQQESEMQKEKKLVKKISNTHILISTQSEMTLSSWSVCLPGAKDLDKLQQCALATLKSEPSKNISFDWLHICKSGFVEDVPKNVLSTAHQNECLPSEETQKAWLFDSLSNKDDSRTDGMLGMALNTDEQSYSVPSHTNTKSLSNGVSKSISGNCNHKYPGEDPLPRKQRSLSEVRTLQKEKCTINKDRKCIPQPSYCVRYRMCFCTDGCSCGGRFDAVTNALLNYDRGLKTSQANSKSKIDSNRTNGNHSETEDNSYDFTEDSTVPSILLKCPNPQSLRKTGRTQSENLMVPDNKRRFFSNWKNGFSMDSNYQKPDGSDDAQSPVRKRRYTSDDLRPLRLNVRPTRHIGDTEIMHVVAVRRKSVERESSIEKDSIAEVCRESDRRFQENIPQKQCINEPTHKSFITTANIAVLKCAEVDMKQNIFCQRTFSTTSDCLYSAGKKLYSRMCKSVLHTTSLDQLGNTDNSSTMSLNDITLRALHLAEIEDYKSSRHVCDLIGGDESIRRLPSELFCSDGVPHNDGGKVACEVMGSHLPKLGVIQQGNAVKETGGNVRRYGRKRKRRGGKVGGVKSRISQRFDTVHNVANGVNSLEAGAIENNLQMDSADEGALFPGVKKIQVHTVEDILPEVKISDADSSDNNGTDSDNAPDGRVSPKQLRSRKVENYVVNQTVKRKQCESAGEQPTENKPTNEVVAPGKIETDSQSIETRSSRRLRLKGNNKRGRYEADYVSDFLKTNKKPKKVLPTRDYDNEDFWQFYRDQENSLRIQTLVRQQRYIRLLRSKGAVATETMPASSQFSNVICSSTSVASEEREPITVPDDGLMPFLKRLTKKRKTFPDLPKVPDEHCAYCGRSFAGQDKKIFEDHLARHGMRYTVLTAPQPPRKKKRFKTTRKDAVLRKSKANGRKSITSGSPSKVDMSYNSRNSFPKCSSSPSHNSDQLGSLKPFPRPAHLSMGHRKQTARKSFSITSSLPKDILIAALECNMRAQSGRPPDTTQPANSVVVNRPHVGDGIVKSPPKRPVYVTKPYTARKTLTGLPITYNHISKRLMQSFSEPYQ